MGDCAFWPAVFGFMQIFTTCVFIARCRLSPMAFLALFGVSFILWNQTLDASCDRDFHVLYVCLTHRCPSHPTTDNIHGMCRGRGRWVVYQCLSWYGTSASSTVSDKKATQMPGSVRKQRGRGDPNGRGDLSVFRIRFLFDSWIRDPGWIWKSRVGSGIRILYEHPGSYFRELRKICLG